MKRNGILAGGNWIIDQIKIIDEYPAQDALSNILEQAFNNGGSPYNILKDLAKLGAGFPLEGVGLVGDDQNGRQILQDCKNHGINSSQIKTTSDATTSFTDVMSVKSTGRRTFFHQRGANAWLERSQFNLKASAAKIFHLGYMLLLDKLDEIDQESRTHASYLFEEAQHQGFITSADLVSEKSDRFKKIVLPSLPYINFLFLNELEAERITGYAIKQQEKINMDQLKKAATSLMDWGVNNYVIIHFPEGALALDKNRHYYLQGSMILDNNQIAGSAGAGDAFAAGVLLGLHEGWTIEESLETGMIVAAASLSHPSCSEGIQPLPALKASAEGAQFRNIS
ncbi:MAG: carbohydrate kinase family protein [Candidatus Cyclobacteriaceae bacterium M3_2C_046]